MNLPTILIIGEDANTSTLLTYALEENHYRVQTKAKSTEGLAACLQQPPDLVIIQYSSIAESPDGLTLCSQIRSHPVLRTIPILMISAKKDEALWAGASAWVDIVFDIKKVLTQVATLIIARNPTDLDESTIKRCIEPPAEGHHRRVDRVNSPI